MNGIQTKQRPVRGSRLIDSAVFARMVRKLSSDSCGCAMGAFALAVGLILASSWYVLHWRSYDLSLRAVSLRVLLWTFLSSCAGKLLGIALFHLRARGRWRGLWQQDFFS